MSNTIRLKRSSTPSRIPTATDLVLGELAVNTYDGNIFMKQTVSGTDTILKFSPYQLTNNTASILLHDDGSVDFPKFKFPKNDGAADQFLVTDGAGNLSWSSTLNLENVQIKKSLGIGIGNILSIANVTTMTDPAASLDFNGLPNIMIQIQTTTNHGLNNGDLITIFGVGGTEELNFNSFYVSVVSTDTFSLYTDSALTAIADGKTYSDYGNLTTYPFRTYTGGGIVVLGSIRFGDQTHQAAAAPKFLNNNSPFDIGFIPGDFYYDDTTDRISLYAKITPISGGDVFYTLIDLTRR